MISYKCWGSREDCSFYGGNRMELTYQTVRSDRKSIAIHLTPYGEIVVRCPKWLPDSKIREFVESKRDWIQTHLPKEPPLPPFTPEEVRAMADRALAVIPGRVAHFAPLVGVSYGRITIRNQRSKWGSCSSKGNLNFNCVLMLAPPEVVDYIVVHELCHRKEMNHSPRFWAEVERVIPNYRKHRQWLSENGDKLIGRLS